MGVNVTGNAPFRTVPHKSFAIFRISSGSIVGWMILRQRDPKTTFVPSPHLNHQPVEQEAVAKIPA
jgi:hypothetical protein